MKVVFSLVLTLEAYPHAPFTSQSQLKDKRKNRHRVGRIREGVRSFSMPIFGRILTAFAGRGRRGPGPGLQQSSLALKSLHGVGRSSR